MHFRLLFQKRLLKFYRLLCCYLFIFCSINSSYAQDTISIRSKNFNQIHEISLIDSLWFYHSVSLSNTSAAVTNTIGWDTLRHTDFATNNPPQGWKGIGWFGIWVKVDTEFVGKEMALRINHDGASKIFLDGRPLGGYGKLGRTANETQAIRAPRDVISLWFNDTQPHLLSVHYANYKAVFPDFLGFQVSIGDYEIVAARVNRSKWLLDFVPMFAAAQIILGLLHFLLFLFYPRQKLNLLYSLFVLLIGINGFAVFYYYQARMPITQFYAEFLTFICKVVILWSGVLLLYALDYGHIPRKRTLALSGISLFYLIAYIIQFMIFDAKPWEDYFSIVFLICIMDGFWSAFRIMKKKEKGGWLIGVGVIAVVLTYFFAWADVFHLWPYQSNSVRIFVMSAGQLLLPLCLSIYLALNFARTNQSLSVKLAEVEKLSAATLAQEAEKRELIAGEAKRLEEIVQQRTAELKQQTDKLKEMDIAKSRFFTNITHEFKTPLTLIINPANELLSTSAKAGDQKQLALILNNANRLLQLINQLLDLSKMENGLMEVAEAPLNLLALIKMHALSYESLAKQKDITINLKTEWNQFWILGDKDKLDKIILNIISNAIKFTDRGAIEIELKEDVQNESSFFTLTVIDSGRGIPADKLPYIFARFYQADPSDTRSAEGTGIGLALAKELVELMGGTIDAESKEHLFTKITVSLPFKKTEAVEEALLQPLVIENNTSFINNELSIATEEKPLVLIIEDNPALRDFIHQTLSAQYNIITAADGEVGIEMALENIPSLIITDVMMPKADGYQVSTFLKKDEKTSHIPIIILTAKSGIDNRIQGIETGADSYLEKPFDKRELLAVMDNLINVRNQLHEHYSKDQGWLKENLSLPSIEQDFLNRVKIAVESHLNEEGYSADQLARDMGLSRTQLHRKLKALIGQAPGEMIRIVRLQYAHDLLKRQVATVAEVAYMVGFSSPASFSASFSRQFGYPPKKVSEQ